MNRIPFFVKKRICSRDFCSYHYWRIAIPKNACPYNNTRFGRLRWRDSLAEQGCTKCLVKKNEIENNI